MSTPAVGLADLDGFTFSTELAGACRLCAYDAYCKDELGPVHPCCVTWQRLLGDKWRGTCPACVESRRSKPKHRRRAPK